MTAKPILFSAPMVRALREGSKTQTRRVLKPQPESEGHKSFGESWKWKWPGEGFAGATAKQIRDFGAQSGMSPYAPGDVLWVRETYFQFGHWEPVVGAVTRKGKRQKWRFVADRPEVLFDAPIAYRKGRHAADPETSAWHQRLGRFMPRWASRLTLEVTGVKVERLQDINEADAKAEGIAPDESGRQTIIGWRNYEGGHSFNSAIASYCTLWNSINGTGAWDDNPWVVAVTFNVHRMNVDAFLTERAREAA